MTVAAIAFARLTPAAEQKAIALLQLNPRYDNWIKDVPKGQQAEAAFGSAAI
jgi:hypothetical protein